MCPWIRNCNCHNTSVPFCSPISSYKAPKVRHKKNMHVCWAFRLYQILFLSYSLISFWFILSPKKRLRSTKCPDLCLVTSEALYFQFVLGRSDSMAKNWKPHAIGRKTRCPFVEALTFSNMVEYVWSCLFITFNTFERHPPWNFVHCCRFQTLLVQFHFYTVNWRACKIIKTNMPCTHGKATDS